MKHIDMVAFELLWRELAQVRHQSDRNYSGPLPNRQKKDINNFTSGNHLVIAFFDVLNSS